MNVDATERPDLPYKPREEVTTIAPRKPANGALPEVGDPAGTLGPQPDEPKETLAEATTPSCGLGQRCKGIAEHHSPRGLEAPVRRLATCLCTDPVATNLPVPGKDSPILPSTANEWSPLARHPCPRPAKKNLPARGDLPKPTPPADDVWEPGIPTSATSSKLEEAA